MDWNLRSYNRDMVMAKGIFFDETIHDMSHPSEHASPPHVRTLHSAMLDFSWLDPEEEDLAASLEEKRAHEAVCDAANNAAYLSGSSYKERRWQNFFETHFFHPLERGTSVAKDDCRREADELWTFFRTEPREIDYYKLPKPDYACFLPLYHLEVMLPKIAEPKARQWNRHLHHNLGEPFSWSCLRQLASKGLRPTPFRDMPENPEDSNLKGFPWLIVEHKKENEDEEQVASQAANGSACAVGLNRITAKYELQLPRHAQVPPIPVVTTVGSKVKVWITYFGTDLKVRVRESRDSPLAWASEKTGYVMKAIWEGDMQNRGDVIRFQAILENTHTWAMRVFKPLIASYIGQWRRVFHDSSEAAEDDSRLEQQLVIESHRRIMNTVQALSSACPEANVDKASETRITPMMMALLFDRMLSSATEAATKDLNRHLAQSLSYSISRGASVHRGFPFGPTSMFGAQGLTPVQLDSVSPDAHTYSQTAAQASAGYSWTVATSASAGKDDSSDLDYIYESSKDSSQYTRDLSSTSDDSQPSESSTPRGSPSKAPTPNTPASQTSGSARSSSKLRDVVSLPVDRQAIPETRRCTPDSQAVRAEREPPFEQPPRCPTPSRSNDISMVRGLPGNTKRKK
ncbi:hypothetical protein GMORB2_0283 [Geosmithia morbida]|uniref:Uncharacterized protein n=1 Tax=Geosmithia morbida TaxID=1094350 RepID=A0A9P4Z327_9HYPO|nr:uncharacterized protein GMORB2_0283 [Geosmithia morbida]KAF4126547.1 hypothetical protein GMORB2_0283 [Geosmithia morbida]